MSCVVESILRFRILNPEKEFSFSFVTNRVKGKQVLKNNQTMKDLEAKNE
jgi:hypothetical protein